MKVDALSILTKEAPKMDVLVELSDGSIVKTSGFQVKADAKGVLHAIIKVWTTDIRKMFEKVIEELKPTDRRAFGKSCAKQWYDSKTYTVEQLENFAGNVIDHDEFDRGIADFLRELPDES